ncbi:hypothetical protein GOC23_06310 [Sinorhizobium meliloti]|nr:hypothetical protein [Sinorhizobium meliloti]
MTFDELLAKYEPAHAAAFRQALEEIKSGIVLRVVVERLERGDINSAIEAMHLEPGQPGQNGPREIILRVIAEEGPMFRPVIRSESRGVSVETIKQYDAAKANIYQNGEDR